MKLNDFTPGDIIIYRFDKYDCDTKSYSSAKEMAVVTKVGDLGVTIEIKKDQNPDHNLHVGSGCLDCLEIVGNRKESMNVIPLRRKA